MILLCLALVPGLLAVIRWRYASVPAGTYHPRPAILKALVYFLMVAALANASSALAWFMGSVAQARDGLWWALSVPLALLVGSVYALIWSRGVFTDGRQWQPLWQSLFGLVWGLFHGLMFLILWQLAGLLVTAPWMQVALSFVLIATFNALWHGMFWDIQVSPPHNLKAWNLRKVLLCHSPNLALSLAHLGYFCDAVFFVAMQMLALMLSSLLMRFPGWNSAYRGRAGEQR